tara:strand:+ start:802 stop:1017 length:216 start_codon:yes stop_codon:yes gene_type:complete
MVSPFHKLSSKHNFGGVQNTPPGSASTIYFRFNNINTKKINNTSHKWCSNDNCLGPYGYPQTNNGLKNNFK